MHPSLSRYTLTWVTLLLVCLAAIRYGPVLVEAARFNLAALQLAQIVTTDSQDVDSLIPNLEQGSSENCRASWFASLLWRQIGADREETHDVLIAAITCSATNIPFARLTVPEDEELAQVAVQRHPTSSKAWFWIARLHSTDAPTDAIIEYQRGLQLDPSNGLAWRELGDLLVEHDPEAAIEAYLQSCYHGDPGFHGCLRAGRTAEEQGDFITAIKYLRLSRWPPARERADELERQLDAPPLP